MVACEKLFVSLKDAQKNGSSLCFGTGVPGLPNRGHSGNHFPIKITRGRNTGRFSMRPTSLPSNCIGSIGAIDL